MSRRIRHIGAASGSLLLALGILYTVLAPPVFGADMRRTWRATMNSNGARGSATLGLYTSLAGYYRVSLSGLRHYATYAQYIYTGTCSSPRTVIRLPNLSTNVYGNTSQSINLSNTQGAAIGNVGF